MNLLAEIRKSIPSIITALNLMSGGISIILAFAGQINTACYFIVFAALFDVFDGAAARLLNAISSFGKQLDSLADVISFGLAPSIILLHYIDINVFQFHFLSETNFDFGFLDIFYLVLAITPAVFGSLRLARYNITESKGSLFQGMPIPASAMIIIGLYYFQSRYNLSFLNSPIFIILFTISINFLLVSKIPMLSLKIKGNKRITNIFVLLLILCFVISFFILQQAALFICLIVYILLSLFHLFTLKNQVD